MRNSPATIALIFVVIVGVPACGKLLDPNQKFGGVKNTPRATKGESVPQNLPQSMLILGSSDTQGKLTTSESASFRAVQGAAASNRSRATASSASFQLKGRFYGI